MIAADEKGLEVDRALGSLDYAERELARLISPDAARLSAAVRAGILGNVCRAITSARTQLESAGLEVSQ